MTVAARGILKVPDQGIYDPAGVPRVQVLRLLRVHQGEQGMQGIWL